MNQKSFLIILDGWGLAKDRSRSAIDQASTPCWEALLREYPHSRLTTHGQDVGLPEGQMGNSEVGHLNIGAGRVVYQELARINKSIAESTFEANPVFQQLVQEATQNGKKRVHLLGLLSDGGVHSHINHIKAIAGLLHAKGIDASLHAFLDGRDTDPHAGLEYTREIMDHIQGSTVELVSLIGRYYAMDRDNRWERVKKAYDLLVHGTGEEWADPLMAIEDCYAKGVTDEFLDPIVVSSAHHDARTIQEGDIVFFLNFRTDRPRQLTTVLSQKDLPEYGMKRMDLSFYTMTAYDETYEHVNVVFEKDMLPMTLGEVLSRAGKTQVRIAETEKYPHVTFFFNGGREEPFGSEKRILVPSPKVATYDLCPEMGALEITSNIIQEIQENQPDFICLNYANTDMVAHTGVFEAAVKAAETVDQCLAELVRNGLDHGYDLFVIADHGNSDYMINDDGSPNTAHTTNLVPFVWVSKDASGRTVRNGKLADVAPTILSRMNVPVPDQMTGDNLLST